MFILIIHIYTIAMIIRWDIYRVKDLINRQTEASVHTWAHTLLFVAWVGWGLSVTQDFCSFFFTHTSQPRHYHSLISLHCSPLNTKLHPKKYWSGCEDSASKVLVLEKRPHALGWKHTQTHTHWHHHQWLVSFLCWYGCGLRGLQG